MTGTGGLLRFMLRRERVRLPWWLLGAALLVIVQSTQSRNLYDTAEALARLRQTIGANPGVVATSGPTRLLDSLGGEVVFEVFGFVAILIGLMNIFLVGRHTRADEETGRAELIRSVRVGRQAPLAAALALAGSADLAVGLLVYAAAAGTGLPVAGSALLGAATGAVGITFAALTAVAAQVFENARAVYGSVALLLGAAYVLRAAGDVGDGTLSWASPIGWAQRTYPYAGDRWWPLLLALGSSALLASGAVALQRRRDFGAGLVPPRRGRAYASPALRDAYALAWRLQRAALTGWTVGLAALGIAYGSIADSIEQYVRDSPQLAEALPGGTADVLDGYLAVTIAVSALLAAAYGVTGTLRIRAEEISGRAEPVLASATSRLSWLAGHLSVALAGSAVLLFAFGLGEGLAYGLTISDAGQAVRLAGVALAYLPAVWLVVAFVVLAVGWMPRSSAALSWVLVGYCAVVTLFADSFDLPGWTRSASPFAHISSVPFEDLSRTPLMVTGLLAAALSAVGYAGLRRRDVGS
jgi:ABC-2 type transport system permease protein